MSARIRDVGRYTPDKPGGCNPFAIVYGAGKALVRAVMGVLPKKLLTS